jgi:hypothetical protein
MRSQLGTSGFPETKVLDQATYLGQKNPKVVLLQCSCNRAKLWRKPRAWWMRLLPTLKLYWCERCGLRVLRKRIPAQRVYTWIRLRNYR